jgi:glycosyltransferase involved in cell wall biosynthesis
VKPKKILIIGPMPEPITGLSISNKVVYKGLIRKGHKVDLIDTSLKKFEESVGNFSLKKAIDFLKIYLKIYKVPFSDIVYISIGQSFLGIIKYSLFIFFSWITTKKIIIHLHGNVLGENYRSSGLVKKKLVKLVLTKASIGIVLSESLKSNLTPFLKLKNIKVLTNFVQDEFFLSASEKKQKEYKKLRIVYLSNLMTEKGIFYLLKALKELNKNKISFKAKVAGNIDEKIYQKVSLELNASQNIEYLGIVKEKEKKDLLIWGNTFVFPSYLTEGLPISILEAMATGNIVVSTIHQSLQDNFSEKNIIYIMKECSESISEKLQLLSNNIGEHDEMLKANYNFSENLRESKFINRLENILIK